MGCHLAVASYTDRTRQGIPFSRANCTFPALRACFVLPIWSSTGFFASLVSCPEPTTARISCSSCERPALGVRFVVSVLCCTTAYGATIGPAFHLFYFAQLLWVVVLETILIFMMSCRLCWLDNRCVGSDYLSFCPPHLFRQVILLLPTRFPIRLSPAIVDPMLTLHALVCRACSRMCSFITALLPRS